MTVCGITSIWMLYCFVHRSDYNVACKVFFEHMLLGIRMHRKASRNNKNAMQ